ncbi:hypothetical protein V2J70_09465 [Pseudomonas alliivorans]|nr:hypothetical protein [Pseudomonas alliivorans]
MLFESKNNLKKTENKLLASNQFESTATAQLEILRKMVSLISEKFLSRFDVINWAAPVPYFGDPCKAMMATVGLNPSDREFVNSEGDELTDSSRRFHTLTSLGLLNWSQLTSSQLETIHDSCTEYFLRNPYDAWFRPLDFLLKGTDGSFYSSLFHACHLDLIPYATAIKWAYLKPAQRQKLLSISAVFLGEVLKYSSIKILVLNGKTVVENFERAANVSFREEQIDKWNLPRKNGNDIKGFSYEGCISRMGSIDIGREIHVLGYNHNIQSSYGVTTAVRISIQEWISSKAKENSN